MLNFIGDQKALNVYHQMTKSNVEIFSYSPKVVIALKDR